MDNNVQVVKCKCGKIFAGRTTPSCYTDRQWIDKLKGYINKGYTLDLIDANCFKFENCTCGKNHKLTDIQLSLKLF